MTNKPTSKVIQILEDQAGLITALCEDGSIWAQYNREKWSCILEAHKEPEANIGKDIQLSKEVEIARMFIAKEKPNKKDSIGNLLKIAENKGYYFSEDSLKIALK